MRILGIETSCDETAAAVVADGVAIQSNVVWSQEHLHAQFGGVVPEIAGRAHTETITQVIAKALDSAGIDAKGLDGIAVTHGPGLIGSLLIGVTAAKALTLAWDLPLIRVNHIEAHLYAGFMTVPELPLPAIGLVASGGHTALYRCNHYTSYTWLGGTIDDAAGESFDKVASILQLGYPGGPLIDRLARQGNEQAIDFPRSLVSDPGYSFSFSGLKTAVLYEAMGRVGPRDNARLRQRLDDHRLADLAASFQKAVVDVLVARLFQACHRERAKAVIIGGGVACNSRLREQVAQEAHRRKILAIFPPPNLCTDNAAMVAGLGYRALCAGAVPASGDLDAIARLPLSKV